MNIDKNYALDLTRLILWSSEIARSTENKLLNINHQIRLYNSAHLCKNWNAHVPFTGFIYQLSEYFIGQRSKEEDSEERQNSATT